MLYLTVSEVASSRRFHEGLITGSGLEIQPMPTEWALDGVRGMGHFERAARKQQEYSERDQGVSLCG